MWQLLSSNKDTMSFATPQTITKQFAKFLLIRLPSRRRALIWWRNRRSSVKAQSTKKSSSPFNIAIIHQSVDTFPAGSCHRPQLDHTAEWHERLLKIRRRNVTWRDFSSAQSRSGDLFPSLTHRQSDRLQVPLLLVLSISIFFPGVFLTH